MSQDLKEELDRGVNELDAFKRVLQAITDIGNTLVDAELTFRDVEERHHTLRLQGIGVSYCCISSNTHY